MKRRKLHLVALFLLAVLMFLASGEHGSYFCVSPWAGAGPVEHPEANAHP